MAGLVGRPSPCREPSTPPAALLEQSYSWSGAFSRPGARPCLGGRGVLCHLPLFAPEFTRCVQDKSSALGEVLEAPVRGAPYQFAEHREHMVALEAAITRRSAGRSAGGQIRRAWACLLGLGGQPGDCSHGARPRCGTVIHHLDFIPS
jgi:hypothetical protein